MNSVKCVVSYFSGRKKYYIFKNLSQMLNWQLTKTIKQLNIIESFDVYSE